MIPVAGFQGTSLIDFPSRISSIIFVAGCNLRCPYCHNGALFDVDAQKLMPMEELWQHLEKRQKFIDGVVITGGEPSLYGDVITFMKELKESFSYEIKLDSNGLNPGFLQDALAYADYICIDIKTTPTQYNLLGSTLTNAQVEHFLSETCKLLQKSGKKIEYRTTMYPPVVKSYDTLYQMLKYVPENADYYLQRFIPENSWSEEARLVESYSPEQLESMAVELRENLRNDRIFLRTYA